MAFTLEELLLCICECMAESLPENWHSAYMQATIEGIDIDARFRFRESASGDEHAFIPANSIAPMNAARELQSLMRQEGSDWRTVTVTIFSDGRFEYFIE